MFIAPLFIIVKIWKQPKCPSRDEWIKRDVAVYTCMHTHTHTYAMKYYSEMLPLVASSTDLEVIVTSETSQTKTNTV